jgi:hypothetical protein
VGKELFGLGTCREILVPNLAGLVHWWRANGIAERVYVYTTAVNTIDSISVIKVLVSLCTSQPNQGSNFGIDQVYMSFIDY